MVRTALPCRAGRAGLDSPLGAIGTLTARSRALRAGTRSVGASLGWALFFTLTAGCPDKKFEFAPDEKPSGPPIPVTLPPGQGSPKTGAAGASGGVQKPTVVLLRRWRGQLAAFACYDATKKSLRGGDDCAELIPAVSEVRIGDASTVRMRRAAPMTCRTPSGAVSHPAFALPDGPPGEAGPHPGPPLALWSSGAAPKLALPPSPPEALPLPPSESSTIRSSSRHLLPVAQQALLGPVVIDSVWTVDLDADGLRERLDQARVLEPRGRFAMLTGVYVVAGKDAVALRPLRVQIVPIPDRERLGRDDHSHDVKLLAAIDLDHDGRRELWLQVTQPGRTTDSVGRYTDTGLAVFGELTCQDDEPAPKSLTAPPAPADSPPHIPR